MVDNSFQSQSQPALKSGALSQAAQRWFPEKALLEGLDPIHRKGVSATLLSLYRQKALQGDFNSTGGERLLSGEFMRHLADRLDLESAPAGSCSRLDLAKELEKPLAEISRQMKALAGKLGNEVFLSLDEEGIPRTFYSEKFLASLKEQLEGRKGKSRLDKEEPQPKSGSKGHSSKKGTSDNGSPDEEERVRMEGIDFVKNNLGLSEATLERLIAALNGPKEPASPDHKHISGALQKRIQDYVHGVEKQVAQLGNSTVRAVAVAAGCKFDQAHKRCMDVMRTRGGLLNYEDPHGIAWRHLPRIYASEAIESIKRSSL